MLGREGVFGKPLVSRSFAKLTLLSSSIEAHTRHAFADSFGGLNFCFAEVSKIQLFNFGPNFDGCVVACRVHELLLLLSLLIGLQIFVVLSCRFGCQSIVVCSFLCPCHVLMSLVSFCIPAHGFKYIVFLSFSTSVNRRMCSSRFCFLEHSSEKRANNKQFE